MPTGQFVNSEARRGAYLVVAAFVVRSRPVVAACRRMAAIAGAGIGAAVSVAAAVTAPAVLSVASPIVAYQKEFMEGLSFWHLHARYASRLTKPQTRAFPVKSGLAHIHRLTISGSPVQNIR